MVIERYYNKFRYTLSNSNLEIGDKVYPIAHGRCCDDNNWILHGFDFESAISGFPNEPHTIVKLNGAYKPYEVTTDCGYSPREVYYKIIKKEVQVIQEDKTNNFSFTKSTWVEVEL